MFISYTLFSQLTACVVDLERRQKVVNRGALRLCLGAWHSNLTKIQLMYSVSYFKLGGLGASFGGLSPSKPPMATGLSWTPYLFDCKPWLINFFSSFHAAYNQGSLLFCFLLSQKVQMTLSFLDCVLSTKFFFCIRFSSASRAHPSQKGLW